MVMNFVWLHMSLQYPQSSKSLWSLKEIKKSPQKYECSRIIKARLLLCIENIWSLWLWREKNRIQCFIWLQLSTMLTSRSFLFSQIWSTSILRKDLLLTPGQWWVEQLMLWVYVLKMLLNLQESFCILSWAIHSIAL